MVTEEVLRKFPRLTRRQTVLLVLVALPMATWLCYIQLSRPGSVRGGSHVEQETTGNNVLSVGKIDTINGNLVVGGGEPEPPARHDWVLFSPIDRLSDRLSRLDVPTGPITLRLVSEKWNIDHILRVSESLTAAELCDRLQEQLSLREHLQTDLSQFPAPTGCYWTMEWGLVADGKRLDPKKTMGEAALTDGAILRFQIGWGLLCQISGSSGRGSFKEPPVVVL